VRIAVVTSLYPSAPLPREGVFAERRWLAMVERGHDVCVIRPVPRVPWPRLRPAWSEMAAMSARENRSGIEIQRPRYLHLCGRDAWNTRAFARCALATLDGFPAFDAVVCDYAWPAAALAPGLERRGIPCLIHGRGSDILEVAEDPALAALLTGWLRTAGHWCAVSTDLVDAMDRLAGSPGRGHLTPNGVDLTHFALATQEDRGQARAALDLPAEGQIFLSVGHWIPRKQPLVALQAFQRAAPQDATLAFLGRGPLEGDLRRAIGARGSGGLAERVRLVGEVAPEELARWYAAADLVLLPSTREGRPNVVLEALACGRPVLATDVGGTAEVLGAFPELLAAEPTTEGFTAALADLLAPGGPTRSPQELRSLVDSLTWENACQALEKALQGAVVGRGRPYGDAS
jgi:glycosyltransferase involved in cell wall biosynthesis